MMKIKKTAILSVSDKTGLADFARGLIGAGYKIIATSGTAGFLSKMGVKVRDISDLTGIPEMLDGRVKTLHPSVFGGVLASGKKHFAEIKKAGIAPIDLVAVNFYPFEEKAARVAKKDGDVAGHIDVGGVAMLRAAAKNYARVIAVSSSEDYHDVLAALSSGGNNENFRKRLASRAFAASAYYDSVISSRLSVGGEGADGLGRHKTSLPLKFVGALRYGENPHQSAAFYLCPSMGGLPLPERLGGKGVSFNNLLDATAGLAVVGDLGGPSACVIIKHTNPCGAAVARRAVDAYMNAFATDPVSSFGGSVVFNCGIDAAAASEIVKVFTDSVVAPSFTASALTVLRKKKNLLILKSKPAAVRAKFEFRSIFGGALVQKPDIVLRGAFRVVTKKRPSVDEKKSLLFAEAVAKYSKSNAVVLASGSVTLGVGSGCVSRIDAFRTALAKMRARPSPPDGKIVLASDAFFPFDDIAREAAAAGVSSIIQPGGSIRDADSVRACDDAGISMVFTGVRHFKH